MPVPIQESAISMDLSPRFPSTSAVLGSPIAASAETIIASLAIPDFGNTAIVSNIRLEGFAAFTAANTTISSVHLAASMF